MNGNVSAFFMTSVFMSETSATRPKGKESGSRKGGGFHITYCMKGYGQICKAIERCCGCMFGTENSLKSFSLNSDLSVTHITAERMKRLRKSASGAYRMIINRDISHGNSCDVEPEPRFPFKY